MNIFDWLSVVGAITGSSSVFALLRTYFKEKASVSVITPHPDLNICPCNKQQDGYRKSHRLIVNVRLENKSSLPVTVTEFNVVSKNRKIIEHTSSALKAVGIYPINIFLDKGNPLLFTLNLEEEQIILPVTIQPYGVVEGFAFFVCDNHNEIFEAYLGVLTTRGIFKTSISISPPKNVDPNAVKEVSINDIRH